MLKRPNGMSVVSETDPAKGTSSGQFHRYPLHSPRFWHGMTTPVLWRMMLRNRFSIAPRRYHVALSVFLFSSVTDVLALVQKLVKGRAIASTEISNSPLFILGHWRSGTTMLHEYFQEDDRFASPSTYQCFAPWHFLLTESMVQRFGRFLLPERRPMDNMKAGWTLPQEDEFALMNLGAPTTYTRIAFPSSDWPVMDALNLEDLSTKELERWKATFLWFLKVLTYRYQKQLILKSPPHTGRLGVLRELFPDAKFVHIVRDPRNLFPSTRHLWRALAYAQSFQKPIAQEQLDDFIIESMLRLYRGFDQHRTGLPENQLVEVKYEDFVQEPVQCMKRIYDQLELGGFEVIRERLVKRQSENQSYRANRHQLDAETEAYVLNAWRDYAMRYGYIQTPMTAEVA